ncbi:MAG: hypothetical protein E7616_01540 [Ruminococcaceae bacterium]|nr:hypothetical protein [Oscillospiraceae bacterium]
MEIKKETQANCETCEFYRYDEELDLYVCDMNLDEDEMADYLVKGSARCVYYRFYDEYKTVQKQN